MSRKLYVGNLPFSVDDQQLTDHFSQAGAVESAKVIMDRASGRSKGFGFVEMADDAGAEAAISQFNGQEFMGRAMTVAEAKPQAPREGGGGRFGGGGGGGGRSRGGFRGGGDR